MKKVGPFLAPVHNKLAPPLYPPTHKQTGPITIHCAAASAQCNKMFLCCTKTTLCYLGL